MFLYQTSLGFTFPKHFYFSRHEKHDQNFDENTFNAPPHCLEEQPPPPGDESEVPTQMIEPAKVQQSESLSEPTNTNQEKVESTEVNGTKSEHHHHHKKSRSSKKEEKEASSDDKKSRDKKKRKKSKEHEKKKNKKDRKEKKVSETPEMPASEEKTPEGEKDPEKKEEVEEPASASVFNRSDSILDINLEDEWIGAAPEVSKWEREENNKSLENSEIDVDVKKGEDKVTSEVIKRAEHVLFTKAISAIRPKSPVTIASSEGQVVAKGSIKNRLGKKITENSRSRTPPPLDRTKKRAESPDRRGKQLSSCIRVSNDGRESRKANDRDRKRTRTPEDRRPRRSKTPEERRPRRSRTPDSRSRQQRPTTSDKSIDSRSKAVVKKHSRSSSSSSASTNSGETIKRQSKHKVKKRSRSPSVKKRKKDKKRKKEKKSKKEKDKSSDRRDRD